RLDWPCHQDHRSRQQPGKETEKSRQGHAKALEKLPAQTEVGAAKVSRLFERGYYANYNVSGIQKLTASSPSDSLRPAHSPYSGAEPRTATARRGDEAGERQE